MKRNLTKLTLALGTAVLAVLVGGHASAQSYPTPQVDLRFSASISGPISQYPQWPNYVYTDSVTIQAGQIVDINLNTRFVGHNGYRGTIQGTPYMDTTIRWGAPESYCPPSSTCAIWNYRTAPMMFPWWDTVMVFPYVFNNAPLVTVDTSPSTPPGTYVIPFSVEENPVSCSQFDGGQCIQTVTKNFTIIVQAPPTPAPTVDLKVNGSDGPVPLPYNGSGTVTWTSTNATSCTVSPSSWAGTSGSQSTGQLTSNRTYTVNCSGAGGTASDTVTVSVAGAPAPTVDIKVNGSDGPVTLPYNGSGTVTWTSTNATSCTVSPSSWAGTSGSQTTGQLVSNQTYAATCTGPGGTSVDSVSVLVQSAPLPTVTLTPNPATIGAGDQSTLTWTVTNATTCAASGGWSGSKSVTGGNASTGSLVVTTTYTLTCTGPGGSASATAVVTVQVAAPSVDIRANGQNGPITIPYNTAATISWTSVDATSCTVAPSSWTGTAGSQSSGNLTAATTYSLWCTGPGGTATDTVVVNVGAAASPTVDLKADGSDGPITVPFGGAATISWTSTNAASCSVNPGSWTGTSGSQVSGAISTARTYTASCTGPGGTATDTVTVTVGAAPPTIVLVPNSFSFSAVSGGSTPPAQNMTIRNTGAGPLYWGFVPVPGKAATWCNLSVGSGTIAAGASQVVSVSVTAPSVVGSFSDCGIRISDPNATNNPQDASVTYTVTQGDPGCGSSCGGGGTGITASTNVCEKVDLSWTPGSGATQYRVYRSAANAPAGASVIATVAGTSYQDGSVSAGSTYYYWVETVGGSGTRVAATSNTGGGVTPTSCAGNPPENPNTKNTSSDASVLCGQVKLTWQAPSSGIPPTGYRVYRSAAGSPYSWQLVSSPSAATFEYTDTTPLVPAGPNYYSVSGMFGSAESGKAIAPSVVPSACAASLDSSDKDITAVNATALSTGVCNGFQAPPSSLKFKLGDVVTYSINLCNSQTAAAAGSIVVTDQLTNASMPAGGWQARYQDSANTWVDITPTVFGTAPNQTLTFSFPSAFNVPAAPGVGVKSVRKIEFKAQLAVPSSFTGSLSRFQNVANIRYDATPGVPATTVVSTPLIPFGTQEQPADRQEVAP